MACCWYGGLTIHVIQIAAEKERQRVDRQALFAKNRALNPDQQDLLSLAKNAASRGRAFDASSGGIVDSFGVATTVDGGLTKDNSRKAYYREFKKVVDGSDVILEILDARDPLGCRTKQIEEMIMASGTNKRVILILNKIGWYRVSLISCTTC